MIDIRNETPITLIVAARMLPPGRRGRPVSVSCMFRWISEGVPGPDGTRIRLEASRAGGRWITSTEALQRFIEAQTPRFDGEKAQVPRTPIRRAMASARATKRLAAAGI